MFYLVLMKVSVVLEGFGVNTTNRQSPEGHITSLLLLRLSKEKLFERENTIKTTTRVKTQHFFKKKSDQMPVTLE